jgi:hypothetical protein
LGQCRYGKAISTQIALLSARIVGAALAKANGVNADMAMVVNL